MSSSTSKDIMAFFPLAEPRPSQEVVIKEIVKAYGLGYKYVILESPVGAGKSAIAMTIANWINNAHILTPRKALQDQYFKDFQNEGVVLMKGRSSYPCTYESDNRFYIQVMKWLEEGSCPVPSKDMMNCFSSPCRDKPSVMNSCTVLRNRTCPYKRAIDIAEENNIIIHNFHSFLYQYHFGMKFGHRNLIVIDEVHEAEGIIRDFATTEFTVYKNIPESQAPDFNEQQLDYWVDYFSREELKPVTQKRQEEYSAAIESLSNKIQFNERYIVTHTEQTALHKTEFKFIPIHVGNHANSLIFSCADKVLLMSGTIYNKDVFCKSLGIKPEEAYFIRTSSSFPVVSRPIYFKPEYSVDTSHSQWYENKDRLVEIIKTILAKFNDVKGLIHVPSYKAAQEIKEWVNDKRLKTHTPETFVKELETFYRSHGNGVFLSPACYQGVDFKQDRARFQIIIRVPYLNTGDKFIEHKVKNDFMWYNHQALVNFGQQIGRINRSEDDFGVTVLIDERFGRFLGRNSKVMPKWLKDSIIYK